LLLAKYWALTLPGWARMMQPLYLWRADELFATLALAVTAIVITPIAEEIFFRGFLLQWMATHRPLWLAMLISSLIFGASHIVPPQMISAALMSLLIAWLYWRSASLWPSIVCHAINNALGVVPALWLSA
jgi:membrane protease YdiL (CAAX protease family)